MDTPIPPLPPEVAAMVSGGSDGATDGQPLPPPLPFDAEKWTQRLTASKEAMVDRVTQGQKNVERYLAKTLTKDPDEDTAVVPADFWYTEQKKAQLFYQVPAVQLRAEDPAAQAAAPLFTAVLNRKILSRRGVDAQRLIDAMVFDIVCPMGFAACKIGYESTQAQVMRPGPPALNPATMQMEPGPPEPTMATVSANYFADRIPPGRLRVPVDFIGQDFNQAAWIGFVYYESAPDGPSDASDLDDQELLTKHDQLHRVEARKRCHEVWYQAKLVDKSAHPDRIRMFQWREGDAEPKVHKDSPYQVVRPDGRLGGMRGYPVSVLTIRTLADSAFPPPDCTIARNTIDEISRGRTQLLTARNRSLPQTGYDENKVTDKTKAQIEQNKLGAWIAFNGPPHEAYEPLTKPQMGPENYGFQISGERDLERIFSLGANQQGIQQSGGSRTATELQIIQGNVDTSLDFSRQRVIAWFCDDLVAKLASLVQQFADTPDYVEVLGPDGAARLAQFTKADIQGDFSFEVEADSTQRHDSNIIKKNWLDFYNLTAKDPYLNRSEVSRQLAIAWGLDPAKLMVQPQTPKPEPPSITLSIKPETDLNPLAPWYPNVVAILAAAGVTLPVAPVVPPIVAPAVTPPPPLGLPAPGVPHPGPVEGVEPVSQHPLDISGRLSGPSTLPH